MDSLTMGILIVSGVAALAFFVWVRVEAWRTDHPKSAADHPEPVVYECDPKTCEHEWQITTEDVVVTIGNSSYGASDPEGVVTITRGFCPKCGSHTYEESEPTPLN